MNKKLVSIALGCSLALSGLYAAPKPPKKSTIANLKKGSVIDGSKASGDLQRWMFFNEGIIGGSWSKIGRSEFASIDFGYSSYIATIGTAWGLRGIFGVDFEFPLYLDAKGQTNALSTHRGYSDVLGWGATIPLSAGIDINGFYIKGLVGYTYNEITERFNVNEAKDAEMLTRYQGIVYGASIGYKIKNIVNIGARALFGNLKNDRRDTSNTTLNQEKTFQDRKYDYMKLGGFISIVF